MRNIALRLRRKWLSMNAPVLPTYEAAMGAGAGYEAKEILDVVERKTKAWAARSHDAPASPGLAVLKAAIELIDKPHILDFGGALGSHYWPLRGRPMRWSVVETPGMAARGVPTEELSFHADLSKLERADIIYCSGVLQSVPDPLGIAGQLAKIPAELMILDRQHIHQEPGFGVQYSMLSANGPGPFTGDQDRIVAYPFAFIPLPELLAALKPWRLISQVSLDEPITVSGRTCEAKLLVLARP